MRYSRMIDGYRSCGSMPSGLIAVDFNRWCHGKPKEIDEQKNAPERRIGRFLKSKLLGRRRVTLVVRYYGLLHQVWSIVYDIGRTGRTRSVTSGGDRHQKNPRVTCDLPQLSCE